MSFWTALVIMVALFVFADVWKARHRAHHGIVEDEYGKETLANPNNDGLIREVEELRERVRVLERIATEDRETKRLTAEIESLRDK